MVIAVWKRLSTYIDRWDEKRRQAAIIDFRKHHPAQIIGVPNLASLEQISGQLDQFIRVIKSYRPEILPCDNRFRSVGFSYPFETLFPRKNCADDGPNPEQWETTLDALAIKSGEPLRSIYDTLGSWWEFPIKEPSISFDPTPPVRLPALLELPAWSIKIVEQETGREINVHSDFPAKVYAPEIEQAEALRGKANDLQQQIKKAWEEAKEEQELMDLFITNQKLRFKELQSSISEEFRASKKRFELAATSDLQPLENTHKDYLSGIKKGVEQHFSLGLETIQLPLPPRFPWRVFYDPEERLIQINQRVPFTSDIVVKRTENKRPLAKLDVDHFLRRLVPAISLHIAANVAANDWRNHIDAIAVNCWSRYFEKTTGKLKDAFVSSLKVEKKTILEMSIDRADALDAFRALRGAFVYSTEEIVPIEPQIRLDKNDARFVAGKEILDGMAQGQNLATMDWQDFEHLIRELLAKEYGKNGSDVRITRASRDKGVDAVVFDPDPLHGGKSVVQAKRYNNLVDVSAVRDLYGTMINEGAARGILVTTSRYGRDAFDFASNKPITLIDGQNLLALLAKHGYQFRIELV
jgi:restriction system protein